MPDNSSNNKRIAKNTLLLYFRMFVTMAVGLYTSRIVLNVLGVSDFGIYNVVGGIITLMSFFNVAMVQASQRFLSFELGSGNLERQKRVFCTSVNIHLIICGIAFLVGETFGLWFVNSKLNIPADRMIAANCVYQASILMFMTGGMSVPYNSSIVAHEKMSAFAYISILEVVLKLIIVYLLLVILFYKLIVYSFLMVLVGVVIPSCYVIYCKRHFEECHYHYVMDRKLFGEMFSLAGWSVFGNLGFSFKDQISNIILNFFYGTTVNAARGIGVQVATMVNTFATNFTMAINPQITKQYALGDIDASRKLVYAGCRFSFYLLSIVSIPIIINIDYILHLWLGLVPDFTSQFVILSIMTSLLYVLSSSVTTAIQATGKIKYFQIGICIIMLSELPVAWVLMELEYPPYAVLWPSLVTYMIAALFRFFIIKRYVEGYYYNEYVINVVLRSMFLFGISYMTCCWLFSEWPETFFFFIISSAISAFISGLIFFTFGMYKSERIVVINKIRKFFFEG